MCGGVGVGVCVHNKTDPPTARSDSTHKPTGQTTKTGHAAAGDGAPAAARAAEEAAATWGHGGGRRQEGRLGAGQVRFFALFVWGCLIFDFFSIFLGVRLLLALLVVLS